MFVNVFVYIGIVTQTSCGRHSVKEKLGKSQTKFHKMAAMWNTRKHLPRSREWWDSY